MPSSNISAEEGANQDLPAENFDIEQIVRLLVVLRTLAVLVGPENLFTALQSAVESILASQRSISSNASTNLPSCSSIATDHPHEPASQESSSSTNPPDQSHSAPDPIVVTHTAPTTKDRPAGSRVRRSGCKGRLMCFFCRLAKRGLPCIKTPGQLCGPCKRRNLPCSIRTWPDGRVEPSDVIGFDMAPVTFFDNGAAGPQIPDIFQDRQFDEQIQEQQFYDSWNETTFNYDDGNKLMMPLVPEPDPGLAVSLADEYPDVGLEDFEFWEIQNSNS